MAVVILDTCIACDCCVSACWTNAISDGSALGKDIYHVDPNLCTECVSESAQHECEAVCPVSGCIVVDSEHQETEETLVARALSIFPNDEELKARIASGNFPSVKRK